MKSWVSHTLIAEHERGLLFQRGRFVRVLQRGAHWLLARSGTSIERHDLRRPRFDHALAEFLVKTHPELLETTFQVFELSDRQVGIEYVDGRLAGIVPPATTRVYWRGLHPVRVDVLDIAHDCAVPAELIGRLGDLASPDLARGVVYSEVAEGHVGLLLVDGRLARLLEPGRHAFWKFGRSVQVRALDQRLQSVEVGGQEILTKDKVSLRLNLTASYRVVDPARAVTVVADYAAALYRELQLGLREAVGTRTLDELLARKNELNPLVEQPVRERVARLGLELASVGVKDVILPGEMKTLLNRVVEAEKEAQANLIRRREETAATRSLHNTARLLESSPVLLRLKELETLEKVTQKIDSLTVYGGLDGVLSQLVQLRPRTAAE